MELDSGGNSRYTCSGNCHGISILRLRRERSSLCKSGLGMEAFARIPRWVVVSKLVVEARGKKEYPSTRTARVGSWRMGGNSGTTAKGTIRYVSIWKTCRSIKVAPTIEGHRLVNAVHGQIGPFL